MQQATAKQTNIKMPARKLRRVINEIRGKVASEALKMLKYMPYFAQEKFDGRADNLKVSEIYADESVTYKRARPRAQGRMYKRLKRTSHITVKLTNN